MDTLTLQIFKAVLKQGGDISKDLTLINIIEEEVKLAEQKNKKTLALHRRAKNRLLKEMHRQIYHKNAN